MSFITENLSQDESVKISKLCALDWELEKANTEYYTHGYHTYSAKYIPQIPNRLIFAFSDRNDLILDPFLGSGTTLVESKVLGRNAIGVDINPLACLISRVKTNVISKTTVREIGYRLQQLQEDIAQLRGSTTLFNYENKRPILDYESLTDNLHPNIPKWYHKNVTYELATIKNNIDTIKHNETRDFLLVAFSSILRSVSNAASGFGNLMINKNTPPKDRIFEKFSRSVESMIKGMSDFGQVVTNCQATVFNHDSRNLGLGDETVDLVCTHPPYMAAVPYAEYQKLSLWWLGYNPSDLDKSLIGGRRSRRDTPKRFYDDMKISLSEMKRVLRKKKYCCITIGNPTYAGKPWDLNDFIKQTCTDIGFTFLKEISRGKYHSTMGKMKEEFILIFRND